MLRDKAYCIYNGYSETRKLPQNVYEKSPDTVDICFLGKLAYYSPASAGLVLGAVSSLRKKGYPFRIVHIGEKEELGALLAKAELPAEALLEVGPLPYGKALSAAENADIFCAVINYPEGLGTKVFDYIYLNRPLVAVAPPGSEFEELISAAENGFVCQTSGQVEAALEKIVLEKIKTLTDNTAFSEGFSRTAQNRAYHKLIKDTLNSP